MSAPDTDAPHEASGAPPAQAPSPSASRQPSLVMRAVEKTADRLSRSKILSSNSSSSGASTPQSVGGSSRRLFSRTRRKSHTAAGGDGGETQPSEGKHAHLIPPYVHTLFDPLALICARPFSPVLRFPSLLTICAPHPQDRPHSPHRRPCNDAAGRNRLSCAPHHQRRRPSMAPYPLTRTHRCVSRSSTALFAQS
jgi:hypothetical protein